MYQWTDPDTGTTQLSGKPPSWYRSTEKGPRVIVFDKGRIIDDTSIELSDLESDELRQQAFVQAEEDMARAQQQALAAEQLKTALDKNQDNVEVEMPDVETEIPVEARAADPAVHETVPVIDDVTADEMKALIDLWEQQKTEQARQKVEADENGSSLESSSETLQ